MRKIVKEPLDLFFGGLASRTSAFVLSKYSSLTLTEEDLLNYFHTDSLLTYWSLDVIKPRAKWKVKITNWIVKGGRVDFHIFKLFALWHAHVTGNWWAFIRLNELVANLLEQKVQSTKITSFYSISEWVYSIGHIARIDLLIKNEILEKQNIIFVYEKHEVVNLELFSLMISQSPHLFKEYDELSKQEKLSIKPLSMWAIKIKGKYYHHTPAHTLVNEEWEENHSYQLLEKITYAPACYLEFLESNEIKRSAKFVVCHFRTEGRGSNIRNASHSSYGQALDLLIDNNYTVLTFGENKFHKVKKGGQLIELRDDFTIEDRRKIEIALIANCTFFIATTSGPAYLPLLFNKPTIYTNWFPIYSSVPGKNTLVLPKRIIKNGVPLSYKEQFDFDFGYSEPVGFFRKENLVVVDNKPNELAHAVKTMMQNISQKKELKSSMPESETILLYGAHNGTLL